MLKVHLVRLLLPPVRKRKKCLFKDSKSDLISTLRHRNLFVLVFCFVAVYLSWCSFQASLISLIVPCGAAVVPFVAIIRPDAKVNVTWTFLVLLSHTVLVSLSYFLSACKTLLNKKSDGVKVSFRAAIYSSDFKYVFIRNEFLYCVFVGLGSLCRVSCSGFYLFVVVVFRFRIEPELTKSLMLTESESQCMRWSAVINRAGIKLAFHTAT